MQNEIIFLVFVSLFLVGCSNINYDEFAKCLTENGAVMYGTDTCRYCQLQKGEFGKSFQYINYVNCIENNDECINKNIEGFPSWIIKGELYEGKQELSRLGVLARCELPKE